MNEWPISGLVEVDVIFDFQGDATFGVSNEISLTSRFSGHDPAHRSMEGILYKSNRMDRYVGVDRFEILGLIWVFQ